MSIILCAVAAVMARRAVRSGPQHTEDEIAAYDALFAWSEA